MFTPPRSASSWHVTPAPPAAVHPSSARPFSRIKRIALAATIVAGTTAVSTGAIAGSAAAACASRTTFQAFSQWGDANQYFVAPNATFESGTSGWTMYAGVGSPSVVADQEPWRINGAGHSKALQLPAYSTAMPPNICLNSNEEWMRFFYKDPAVSGAQLLVKIEAWSSAGRTVQEIRINSGSAGWQVSKQIADAEQARRCRRADDHVDDHPGRHRRHVAGRRHHDRPLGEPVTDRLPSDRASRRARRSDRLRGDAPQRDVHAVVAFRLGIVKMSTSRLVAWAPEPKN